MLGTEQMDVINSLIAVGATLAGLWTSAVLNDVRSSSNDTRIVAVASEIRSRSIDLSGFTFVRAAPAPGFNKPLR